MSFDVTIIIFDYRITCEQSQLVKKKEGGNMKNLDIRILVSEKGLKYKDIADELNISREWLSRLMRDQLTIDNRVRILGAIEKLTRGAESNDI